MARYQHIDTNPRFRPVDLARQLWPGTFEHALNHRLEPAIDLSSFDARCRNEATGATAYPPAVLLKVVLFAYSQGIVSRRGIERVCQEHVTFIARRGDTAPHFTTIAHVVSTLGDDIARVVAAGVAIGDAQGLIGRAMFAIDGVKLPSHASKRRSGTRADFERQATKLATAVPTMLTRHRATDALPTEPTLAAKAAIRLARLERDAAPIRDWLAIHPEERRGVKGAIRKRNRTDNERAKMATGNGVIQGYPGVAAVEGAYQIIVEAQAHGTGSEQEVLLPVVTAMLDRHGMPALLTPPSLITADAGYHREANRHALATRHGHALIADNAMRRRDERFATQGRHQALPDPRHHQSTSKAESKATTSQPSDCTSDAAARTGVCPAGKSLDRTGRDLGINGYVGEQFRGAKRDWVPCAQRGQCLRPPEHTQTRQVVFVHGRVAATSKPATATARMKRRIDAPDGRARYGQRFGTVEPVFGTLCYHKGLDRFTLRGRRNVDAPWTLFCLVHTIEKLAPHRSAA